MLADFKTFLADGLLMFFSVWKRFGGLRCLVINSLLLLYGGEFAPDLATEQEVWMTEEIEQAKLCAVSVIVFTFHPWYYTSIEEDDDEGPRRGLCPAIPKIARKKWLQKLRHRKVQLAVAATRVLADHSLSTISAAPDIDSGDGGVVSGSSSAGWSREQLRQYQHPVRPFPIARKRRGANAAAASAAATTSTAVVEEVAAGGTSYDSGDDERTKTYYSSSGDILKPSEIIAEAVASGELRMEDTHLGAGAAIVSASSAVAPHSLGEIAQQQVAEATPPTSGAVLPPIPPTESEEQSSQMQRSNNAESDSDTASVETNDSNCNEPEEREEEEEFLNEQETSEGPEVLNLPPISTSEEPAQNSGSGVADIQFFLVGEEQIQYRMYSADSIPKSIALLTADFE